MCEKNTRKGLLVLLELLCNGCIQGFQTFILFWYQFLVTVLLEINTSLVTKGERNEKHT